MFATKTIHTLVGASKTGKSHLLQYILTTMMLRKEFNFGLVFTATKFNSGYNFLPDRYVFADFDMAVLQKWLRFLEKIQKAGKEIPPSFMVFDDIISSIPQTNKAWAQFISTYRHYNITLFFTTQYPNMIAPLLRSQTEYAYLFQMTMDGQYKASYLAFGGMLPNNKAWKTYVNAHTGDYKCIVYYRDAPPTLVDRYKQFKAPPKKRLVKFEF